jgi:uncharacterized protein (UPF0332 family)
MSQGIAADAADFLDKAHENLQAAELLLASGLVNACANRCYYACYHAAVAALMAAGVVRQGERWQHDTVESAFNGLLIHRRKLYPSDLRDVLRNNREHRERADYRPAPVSKTETERALRRSRSFVNAVTMRLRSQP